MITQIIKIRSYRLRKQIMQIAGIGLVLVLGLAVTGQAQEDKEKAKTTSAIKEVQGEISGIGRDYIAIVYDRDTEKGVEYEILLPIEEDIKLVRKRKLNEIKVGDIVGVQYEESKEGPKLSRKAKIISFIKPAEKKPEPVEMETDVLNSGASGDEGLSLKGLRGLK